MSIVHRLAIRSVLKSIKASVKSYLLSKESMRGETRKVKLKKKSVYIYVVLRLSCIVGGFLSALPNLFNI